MSDWKIAGGVALLLLGLAVFLVFAMHVGFEGQTALLFALLPGAFFIVNVGEHVPTLKPMISSTLWPFVLFLSYLWYFALSYCAIKIWRAMYPPIPERP